MIKKNDPLYVPPKNAEELLRRYASGERIFTDLGDDKDFDGNFQNADLSGATFSGYITADFTGANLENAKFSGNIKTSRFCKANLTHASFRDAAIDGTDFKDAILDGADFTGASIHSYVFKENEKP
jgi:uncharacterized protein YjbI with pentapeptide repeats